MNQFFHIIKTSQDHTWVKVPFKVQVRQIDFNLNVMGITWDHTFQLPCKKLPFVEIWCNTKEGYSQLSEKDY